MFKMMKFESNMEGWNPYSEVLVFWKNKVKQNKKQIWNQCVGHGEILEGF